MDRYYGDQVQIYLVNDLTLLQTFFIHKYENDYKFDSNAINNEIEFSPDGSLLAFLTKNQAIVWNLGESSEVFFRDRYSTGYFSFQDIIFSPDGKYFALATYDEVLLYSMEGWSLINTLKNIGIEGSTRGPLESVAFSPDGRYLAAGSDYIITWQISDGQLDHYFGYEPPQYVFGFTDLAWSKDGKSITTTANLSVLVNAQSAIIWDATNGTVTRSLEGFMAEHRSITVSYTHLTLPTKRIV